MWTDNMWAVRAGTKLVLTDGVMADYQQTTTVVNGIYVFHFIDNND